MGIFLSPVSILSAGKGRVVISENKTNEFLSQFHRRRDRLVVRTLRCGRSNPGSNPGHGTFFPLAIFFLNFIFLLI